MPRVSNFPNGWWATCNNDSSTQLEKMVEWGRERAPKSPDGNCFYYSLGEALDLFEGYANLAVSQNLRVQLATTMNNNQEQFMRDVLSARANWGGGGFVEVGEGDWRQVSAPSKADLAIRALGDSEFFEFWVKEKVFTDGKWAGDDIGSMATSLCFMKDVVIFYAERGVSMLCTPGADYRYVLWEDLCALYPTQTRRDAVIVILYDGHHRRRGVHFEHARKIPEARRRA